MREKTDSALLRATKSPLSRSLPSPHTLIPRPRRSTTSRRLLPPRRRRLFLLPSRRDFTVRLVPNTSNGETPRRLRGVVPAFLDRNQSRIHHSTHSLPLPVLPLRRSSSALQLAPPAPHACAPIPSPPPLPHPHSHSHSPTPPPQTAAPSSALFSSPLDRANSVKRHGRQ